MRHHPALALCVLDKDAQASGHHQEQRGIIFAVAFQQRAAGQREPVGFGQQVAQRRVAYIFQQRETLAAARAALRDRSSAGLMRNEERNAMSHPLSQARRITKRSSHHQQSGSNRSHKLEAGAARNSSGPAISQASPSRPSMVRAASRRPSPGGILPALGKAPGTSALTRIFVRSQLGGEMAGELHQAPPWRDHNETGSAARDGHIAAPSGATRPYIEETLITLASPPAATAALSAGRLARTDFKGCGNSGGIGGGEITGSEVAKMTWPA